MSVIKASRVFAWWKYDEIIKSIKNKNDESRLCHIKNIRGESQLRKFITGIITIDRIPSPDKARLTSEET